MWERSEEARRSFACSQHVISEVVPYLSLDNSSTSIRSGIKSERMTSDMTCPVLWI